MVSFFLRTFPSDFLLSKMTCDLLIHVAWTTESFPHIVQLLLRLANLTLGPL